jgi:hypothetical protein
MSNSDTIRNRRPGVCDAVRSTRLESGQVGAMACKTQRDSRASSGSMAGVMDYTDTHDRDR